MPTTTTITKEGTRAVSPVGGGDEVFTSLSLKGTDLSAQIIDAVLDGDIELTIEGASTISVTVHDPGPEYALLNSGVYSQPEGPIVMELPSDDPEEENLRFVLDHVEKNGDESILTFEDEIVYWLGQYDKPVKAARDKVTRAEFIIARVREVKEIVIPFFCPEIDVKVPIAKTPHKTNATTTREKDAKRGGGFHSNSKITVKRSGANATQIRNIEKVLDVCSSHNAPTDVLVMAVMTITQESNAGTDMDRGGDAGLFSKLSHTGGVESDTNAWLTGGTDFQGGGALASYKKNHGKHTLGWICTDVQRDYTWGTSGQGKDFQQWRDEAQRTVRLYGGGSDSGSLSTRTEQRTKRYEFSRGRPGGPKGENTWGMGLRLAQEVKWRFFVAIGVLYLISEPELLSSRTRLTVGPETDGIENVDFGWNVASKKDIPPSEITITARADRWGVPPGAVIELEGHGVANGWWLVSTIKRGLFDPTCEVTCKQPSKPRDEPAPETVEKTTKAAGSDGGGQGHAPSPGYPLAEKGKIIGTPHTGTHTLGNWQSDNAVDITAQSGTPVLACVRSRVTNISGQGGNSTSGGRFAGFGITLEGEGQGFFYKHLRSKSVNVGDTLNPGEVIGHSGVANGIAHLHFGVREGSPYKYTGKP